MGTDPSFSDPPLLPGEQPPVPARAEQVADEPSGRTRRRRRSSRDDASGRGRTGRAWKTAATVVPPVATIGAALAVIGWIFPVLALVRSMRLLAWATIATLAIAVVLMIAGLNRGSRRLRRREFWLSLLAALLVAGMLLVVQRRAQLWQQRTGESVDQPPPAEPGEQ